MKKINKILIDWKILRFTNTKSVLFSLLYVIDFVKMKFVRSFSSYTEIEVYILVLATNCILPLFPVLLVLSYCFFFINKTYNLNENCKFIIR